MTIHLTLGNLRLSFGLQAMFGLLASVGVALVLSAYLDALHASVRRGEALGQSQSGAGIGTLSARTASEHRAASSDVAPLSLAR